MVCNPGVCSMVKLLPADQEVSGSIPAQLLRFFYWDQARSNKIAEGAVCTRQRVLLFIPVLEKHRWSVKQIPINSETGNMRQALAFS